MNTVLLVKSAVITGFMAIFVFATVLAMRPNFVGTRHGKPDENYLQSENCQSCHRENFASWQKTYHSRMTQDAGDGAVLGDFETNNKLEYLGVKATMTRRGADYLMSFVYPDGRTETNQIFRTVGSRRIQQYVTRQGTNYVRLPVAWDVENQRWMSLNGSFFYPDGNNFKQHEAKWDLNCVFCHNVKAQPNFNFQTAQAKTEVSELGIACGACHGQAATHAQEALSPVTRAAWHLDETANRSIVNPNKLEKLDSDRSMMICAHCHGQRIPAPDNRIREILAKGDPFDAGEDLSQFYQPIHADTTIGNVSFAARFWADGSPRLTAFEYQGLTASECFLKGEKGHRINCLTCHTMHEGDPKGQLTEDKKTNLACTECHTKLNDTVALQNHTKHQPDSAGSSCYSCHMPEVVYGIMTFHPTHEITIPRPDLTALKQVPNACNQCHVDKSVNWAIQSEKNLWADKFGETQVSADNQFNEPEAVRMLFAGDALQRSLAAFALQKHAAPDFFAPFLAEAFATENYPIVRYFAANGLQASHPELAKPDYLADAENRRNQIAVWFNQIDPQKAQEAKQRGELLRKLRKDVDVEVGE